jgi:cell wall-associated NlpC family hydrolase
MQQSSPHPRLARAALLIWLALAAGVSAVYGYSQANERRITLYDGAGIVAAAEEHLGAPYRPGGVSPAGFDCSGFTSYVYRAAGYQLPRTASDQYRARVLRPVRAPRPGDLLFFRLDGTRISHVGIYVGDYKFIHAPSSGRKVSYADIRLDYWKKSYAGARSIFRD